MNKTLAGKRKKEGVAVDGGQKDHGLLAASPSAAEQAHPLDIPLDYFAFMDNPQY